MPELLPPLGENTGVSWAEEVEAEHRYKAEAESHLGPRQEFRNGDIKTVIEYRENEDGQTIKIVSDYKIETKKVSKAVARRKKLPKFGAAAGDPPGPNIANTSIGEQIKIQFVRSRGGELLELTKNEDEALVKLKQTGGAILKCRFCKSPDHMSAYCPYKDLVESADKMEAELGGTDGMDAAREKEAEEKMKAGTYVPPSLRGGAVGAAARTSGADLSRRDDFTVRVTNLPDETTEQDLKELFNSVGKVQRIYLAKDKTTNRCKGFAFITYQSREDAEKAIHAISGHRYDHLILKVEWAKPTT